MVLVPQGGLVAPTLVKLITHGKTQKKCLVMYQLLNHTHTHGTKEIHVEVKN